MKHALPGVMALLVLGACSEETPLRRCPLGDPTAQPQFGVYYLDRDYVPHPVPDDGVVPLAWLTQGGWGLLLGVRATNIDGCQMTLTTSFRDECAPDILKVDNRDPPMLDDDGPGWGVMNESDVSNLQVCAIPNGLRNYYEEPFLFTVTVSDIDGRTASQELRLTPVCPDDVAECACWCDKNYLWGQQCSDLVPNTESGPTCS